MASRGPDYQERLREGIEAARRGDRVNARRLLQQVLIIDRDNEIALMWMASVVDSMSERRAFLERVLRVNPNNARAREALQRMGVNIGTAPAVERERGTGTRPAISPEPTRRGSLNLYLIAAAVIAIVTIAFVVTALNSTQPQQTQEQIAQATLNALVNSAVTTSPTAENAVAGVPTSAVTATPTVFVGVLVTIDPNAANFPATFTPTDTPLPTSTFTPTATFIPPSTYQVIYGEFAGDSGSPGLYRVTGDGGDPETIGNPIDGFFDAALSPDGERIAFVRPVENDDGETLPQLFIAPLANLDDATQITSAMGSRLASPSWSPDGQRIVYSGDQDGDDELWIVTLGEDENRVRQVTFNEAADTTPMFSPDGNQLVFTSDVDSPGYTEIYMLDLQANRQTRLSDEAGQNYSPAWSPDGERIAFISTQGVDGDIYIMDADGQRKFLLTVDDGGAEDRSPRFSPDGAYIGFISNRDDGTFSPYLLNVRNDEIIPIVQTESDTQSLTFNPTVR